MRATLAGKHEKDEPALALRRVLAERHLPPTHALDLLEAFRRDVVKARYANWDELMDYCRYSAAPVGRMVLDIHGEDHATAVAGGVERPVAECALYITRRAARREQNCQLRTGANEV